MKRFLLVALSAAALSVFADEPEHPLLPADTSSPRATVESFMANCETAYTLLQKEGRSIEDEKVLLEARKAVLNSSICPLSVKRNSIRYSFS